MIIVDTSVWIDHLRNGVPALALALEDGLVLMHPFVQGELACGNLKSRREVLYLMGNLPQPVTATHPEVLTFIEKRTLMDRGIGLVDVHLLASTALTNRARLWTRDRRLRNVAAELALGIEPAARR